MLNAKQQAIVVGTLLGDGCLEKNGIHVRLKVDHGVQQKAYVEWKFHELAEVAASPPKQLEFFDRRTQRVYTHWRFATKSIADFDPFWEIFYVAGRKQIPTKLSEFLLSPLALAVWYMDDGYRRKDCKSLHLNTQGYTEEEQTILQKCLLKNFEIFTKIHWAGKHAKLYIPSNQSERFCNIIKPFMIPSMERKLLEPRNDFSFGKER